MLAAQNRPMTPAERKNLEESAFIPSALATLWDTAMGSGCAVGCAFVLLFSFVMGGIALLPEGDAWRPPAVMALLSTSFIAWLVTTIVMYRKTRPGELLESQQVQADLDEGFAVIEKFRAKDAILAIVEEHRERCFFMLLEDDRVMFVGPWAPTEDDNPSGIEDRIPEEDNFPSAEYEVARAPRSRHPLGIRGIGQPIRPSGKFEVRAGRDYPDYYEIIKVPWGKIIKTYR